MGRGDMSEIGTGAGFADDFGNFCSPSARGDELLFHLTQLEGEGERNGVMVGVELDVGGRHGKNVKESVLRSATTLERWRLRRAVKAGGG
eukprot:scaffold214656_cov31-Tisochrysis_lutea.AAC.1